MDSFRTFIAIELPPDVRARVAQHIACLRHELPDVRASWSREDNLHLTLKFLGNVPVADIPKVSNAVERARQNRFQLSNSHSLIAAHSRPAAAQAFCGSVRRPLACRHLHAAIEQELDAAGFPRESRPFHPHLTIARLRQSQGARQLAELHQSLGFAPIAFAVSEVVVFRSELLKQGSKHTAISRHKLV